jgi:hypothetical protein
MADGVLTLLLSDDMAARLKVAAHRVGVTPEALAIRHLDQALSRVAFDTTEAERRLAEYDRTGQHIGFEDWSADFRASARSDDQTSR